MTDSRIQNIKLPYSTFAEGDTPSNPDAGHYRLFFDEADGSLKKVDSSGTVSAIGGGSGATVVKCEAANGLNMISTGDGSLIQFNTVTTDPDGVITTGASWKFTAPFDGVYDFIATVSAQSGNEMFGRWYKNGSAADAHHAGSSGSWNTIVCPLKVVLVENDYIQLYVRTSSGTQITAFWNTLYATYFPTG